MMQRDKEPFIVEVEPLLPLPDPIFYAKCKTMTEAIKQAQTISGLEDKELCGKGPDDVVGECATWSRIKNGTYHFPQDRLVLFNQRVGNLVTLAWLAEQHGYMLRPKETELHKQLRLRDELIRELRNELDVLSKYVLKEAA
jgi:hypothetical protein